MVFRARRLVRDLGPGGPSRWKQRENSEAPLLARSETVLWSDPNPAERDLTAGKIENLRVALRGLDRLFIPPGEVFSFWKQVGPPLRLRGFVRGREVREGCIIPNIGGGLCQLSNALHDAALRAGIEIVERHAHTRVIPGSLAEQDRDATVFWNYVDLRFRAPARSGIWIRAEMGAENLVVEFRGDPSLEPDPGDESPEDCDAGLRARARNCLTCGVDTCFRSQPTTVADVRHGRRAILVDAHWPEHADWIENSEPPSENDTLLFPLDGKRTGKANYAWETAGFGRVAEARWATLRRSWLLRNCPPQGRELQERLLRGDRGLARHFARNLGPEYAHLVVAQNLLPHLWETGILGGRSFDVLMTRLPMPALQSVLDDAAERHPESDTLGDFRVDDSLAEAESRALARATRIITPHTEIAALFPNRAVLVPWAVPDRDQTSASRNDLAPTLFFPASALGRCGIYLLRDALGEIGWDDEVWIGGMASDGGSPLGEKIRSRIVGPADHARAGLIVLPAYVAHQPRRLLEGLARGIPVIATTACGLPEQEGLTLIPPGDSTALATAIRTRLPAYSSSSPVP